MRLYRYGCPGIERCPYPDEHWLAETRQANPEREESRSDPALFCTSAERHRVRRARCVDVAPGRAAGSFGARPLSGDRARRLLE
jgi:hypothetical protein